MKSPAQRRVACPALRCSAKAALVGAVLCAAMFGHGRALAATKDALPPKAPLPLKAALIEVTRASYGAPYDQTPCDVSARVKSDCDERFSCAIVARDSLCTNTGTPPPLIPTLRVTYRCSDSETTRSQSVEKPFTLRISCTPLHH